VGVKKAATKKWGRAKELEKLEGLIIREFWLEYGKSGRVGWGSDVFL